MLNHLGRFFLFGGILELSWLMIYGLGPLRTHSSQFVGLMLANFAICVLSYFCCPISNRRGVICVLAFALLFRLTVLPASPDESEDVYRYLWDGRLASLGVDPYRLPPDAAELVPLRDQQIYPMLNSRSYVTAYPPLSQALFQLSFRMFGASVFAMKAIFSLFEFMSLLVAWRLLILIKANPQPLMLMAWNPFFVFEFSHSGHSDSCMMFFILLGVFLIGRSRSRGAMASFGAAILAKLHPALWLPILIRRVGWKAFAVCLSVVGVGTLTYFSPATALGYMKSLRLYYRLFEFNAGIHYVLRFLGHTMWGQAWDKLTGPYLAGILVLVAGMIAWRFPCHGARDTLHAGFWIMTADLCLSTTVHPWYISWAALALPIFPYMFMFYWTGACFLSYLAYAHQPVYEPTWVLLVEYVPVYCLMAWEIYRGRPAWQPDERGRLFV